MSEWLTTTDELVIQWREMAVEYEQRHEQASKRREHIIAAQQGGLASALKLCANQLEAIIEGRRLTPKRR